MVEIMIKCQNQITRGKTIQGVKTETAMNVNQFWIIGNTSTKGFQRKSHRKLPPPDSSYIAQILKHSGYTQILYKSSTSH